MKLHKLVTTGVSVDVDGVATAQSVVGATALILDGAFTSSTDIADMGVVSILTSPEELSTNLMGGSKVSITSASADESGITFTVVGQLPGTINDVAEVVTGPGAGLTVITDTHFANVKSVTTSGSTTGDVFVGNRAVGSAITSDFVSAWLLPSLTAHPTFGLQTYISTGGSLTYTLQVSMQPNVPEEIDPRVVNHNLLTGRTIDFESNIAVPFSGLRILFPSGTYTSGDLTVVLAESKEI